ncbi:DNA primase [Bacillus sp. APMAM]|nr:DNA primase [Bacillus sp. APMAM]RTZ53450.1 DNA primase [Bacillus sp. SAJ1]
MNIQKQGFDNKEIQNYITPKSIEFVRILDSFNRIKALLGAITIEGNIEILATAFEKVAGEHGMEYFAATLYSFNKTPLFQAKELFGSVKRTSYALIPEELIDEVKLLIKVGKAESRGFIYDEKKDRFTFNANAFAKHFVKRCVACSTEDGRIFIYNKKGVYEELPEVKLGKLIRHIMHEGMWNSWRSTCEVEAIKAIQREIPTVVQMNSYRNYINLKNGMLCLDNFELHSHSPKYVSTIQLPIIYDPNAKAPTFEKFMQEITNNDDSLISVHQEVAGNCLTSETKAEKAVFYYGRGANGKSVFASTLTELVGRENVSNIPLSNFNQDFGLESIINKSVNIASENELGGKFLKTENFKAIVSGDRININKKYHSHINYQPFCKLIFLVNNIPDTSDTTNGYFRKILIIPFNRTFKENERDVNLKEKLLKELPGILNWALEGLKRLRENQYQFSKSAAIEKCMEAYFAEQNPVREFFKEHIIKQEDTRTRQSDFYDMYSRWLTVQGIDDKGTKSRQIFWKQFKIVLESEQIPITKKKIKGIVYFEGLRIVGLDDEMTPTLTGDLIQF